jgi:hypothetical protein
MTKIRSILVAAVALTSFAVSVNEASATSLAVKMACASDYYAHCSQHDPDSPGVRKCMRAVGRNLSQGCLGALVAAGEVSKSVIEKKVAAK